MTTKLDHLHDDALIARGDRAVREEHVGGLWIIAVLIELGRRGLHVERGYPSLADYCLRRWRFSRAKTFRYLAVARASERFPLLRTLLADGTITISAAARLAGTLTETNHEDVLRRAAGRSYAEIEAMVMERRVAPAIPDRVRPVGAAHRREPGVTKSGTLFAAGVGSVTPENTVEAGAAESIPGAHAAAPGCPPGASSASSSAGSSDSSSASPSASSSVRASSAAPARESGSASTPERCSETEEHAPRETFTGVTEIRFGAGPEFVRKLRRAQVVCSHSAGLEAVLERALDELLERHDPVRRSARRIARRARRLEARGPSDGVARRKSPAQPEPPAPGETPATPRAASARQEASTHGEAPTSPREASTQPAPSGRGSTSGTSGGARRAAARSRHVPAAIRDVVSSRDGLRCTYVGPDGVRCSARRFLQFDHVNPFSRGGEHSAPNGRVLCGIHNRLEARRLFGLAPRGRGNGTRRGGESRR